MDGLEPMLRTAMLKAFQQELEKFGSMASPTKAELRAEAHFGVDRKNWPSFEKDLRSKAFQKAILSHPDADQKLKRYTKNVGAYKSSKDVVGVAPSRTEPKGKYLIKQLPSGRWACGCKDWQYVHSVKNTDCDHITATKAIYQQMKTKKASLYQAARGAGFISQYHKGKKEDVKGKTMQENVLRLRTGMPLLPVSR